MKKKPTTKPPAMKTTGEATSTSPYTGLSANQDADTTEEQGEPQDGMMRTKPIAS
jgi:hypothetical protein